MIKKPFECGQTDQTIDVMNHVNLKIFCLYDWDVKDLPQKITSKATRLKKVLSHESWSRLSH